ncbi:MAG: right-handed parallel beta-helix repeat-containing protein, partial [Planctomycetota bacterium]
GHNSSGGGIHCSDGGSPIIHNNVITENVADDLMGNGGGICCISCDPRIESNVISGNDAGEGGGIYIEGASSSSIVNNTITDNFIFGQGGGIYVISSDSLIICNTIMNNITYLSGGGIQCDDCSPIVCNSILWNNHAMTGPEIAVGYSSGTSNLTISYSDVKGGQASVHVYPGSTLIWGSGMIDADPVFVDPANNDFHLTYPSPCKDTGDNFAPGLLVGDFEGDPRIAYGTVDMGADEFYTHLYCTGDFTPDGLIEGKLVGLPGTSPVGLFLGSGVLDPPVPTAWGNFYLQAPWFLIPLVPIPANGVLVLPATIPGTPPAPYDLPMQALIGLEADSLSNLCVLEVR